jgi:hypothetical protein
MTILNTFANQSGQIPLSQLDSNFAAPITIGTTPIILGDIATTITGLTLAGADLGTPTGNLANCIFPTLNQNTIGTASNVTGVVAVGNGGTGVTTSTGTGSTVLSATPTFTGTVNTANLAYTGTLTGGTGTLNIGSGQVYKDAGGNVGIGTTGTTQIYSALTTTISGNLRLGTGSATGFLAFGDIGSTIANVAIWRGAGGNSLAPGNYLQMGGYDGISFTTGNASLASQTERMRIDASGNVTLQNNISVGGAAPTTSGTGITFPAANSASANANTLDDYEEGTWTPTYVNFTITSGTSEARYTRVGRVITANIWINATAVSCLVNATFTLPIAAVSYSAGSAVSANVAGGIQITGTTAAVRTAMTASSNLALTVTYQLAS